MPSDTTHSSILAQEMASLIVHDNCPWSIAREKVRQNNGLTRRGDASLMPSGEIVESAVRETFSIFMPQEHARVLDALRRNACDVMTLLNDFPVFLSGAVLNGAANRESSIVMDVFHDDVKAVEIALMDAGVDFEAIDPLPSRLPEPLECLGFVIPVRELRQFVGVRVNVYESHVLSRNPYKREPDPWQNSWESAGRIDLNELKRHL